VPERIGAAGLKLGRFAEPSDLIGAALFLASPASDFISGHTLVCGRRLARRRLSKTVSPEIPTRYFTSLNFCTRRPISVSAM